MPLGALRCRGGSPSVARKLWAAGRTAPCDSLVGKSGLVVPAAGGCATGVDGATRSHSTGASSRVPSTAAREAAHTTTAAAAAGASTA